MATAVQRAAPSFGAPQLHLSHCHYTSKTLKLPCVSFTWKVKQRHTCPRRCRLLSFYRSAKPRMKLSPLYSFGETTDTQETEEKEMQESEFEDNSDGTLGVEELAHDDENAVAEEPTSAIVALIQEYKEALSSNDESRVTAIEAYLLSLEAEKIDLERRVAILSKELSNEKDRILRISADFDNFRKRTEREKLSVVTNAQGEVIENLLSVLDNFERAKTQIKAETEGEIKINDSYQNIYKQLVEILGSLGVVSVETIGIPFDPSLHEAIMREDSTEFEEGIVIDEFRKGFKLGDRLLRPAMVKVSAGPGPAKPEADEVSEESEPFAESSEAESKPEPAEDQ